VGIEEIWLFLTAVASGVVKGERGTRENTVPPNIFLGTPFPQMMSGQGETVAFPQIGLQRNAKSMVTVRPNSSVIKVKCIISHIVICIGELIIHRLKSNIVTAHCKNIVRIFLMVMMRIS